MAKSKETAELLTFSEKIINVKITFCLMKHKTICKDLKGVIQKYRYVSHKILSLKCCWIRKIKNLVFMTSTNENWYYTSKTTTLYFIKTSFGSNFQFYTNPCFKNTSSKKIVTSISFFLWYISK